jgi:hypothetical protein
LEALVRDDEGPGAGEPDDGKTTLPERGGDGGDGVVEVHRLIGRL